MSELMIRTQWADMHGHERPHFEVTFATLHVRVGDEIVTEVRHRSSETTRDHVLVPLYPIAEWIVANWWALQEETDVPGRDSFLQRHSLIAGREGYCLPDLRLAREGVQTRLEWRRHRYQHGQVEFLSEGSVRLPHQQVTEALCDFVNAVDERLQRSGIADTWLQTEWTHIQESLSDKLEVEFCKAAAWLGLDPYELSEEDAAAMIRLFEKLPEPVREDAFRCSSEANPQELADWLDGATSQDRPKPAAGEALLSARAKYRRNRSPKAPWEAGQEIAHRFRRDFSLKQNDLLLLENFLGGTSLPVILTSQAPSNLDGLGFLQDGLQCCTPKRRPDSQRFVVARSLYDFLLKDAPLTLLTAARTEHQQESRAFAAELLAPVHLIKARLTGDTISPDQIADMAGDFRVSEWVIEHQIQNHHLAQVTA